MVNFADGSKLPLTKVSHSGEAKEDCDDRCYGHRDQPFNELDGYLPEQADGCTYHMHDTPGVDHIDTLKKFLEANAGVEGLDDAITGFDIEFDFYFLGNIIDTCQGGVLWAETFQKGCKATVMRPF